MKKAVRLVLALILALTCGLCLPGNAVAADDDFAIEFGVTPLKLPEKGGASTLTLTIRNMHATKTITSFTVQIEPNTVFKHEWNTSIAPHDSQTVSCPVPFEGHDLGRELMLAVFINNDSDANPDGMRSAKFEITPVNNPISVTAQFSPAGDPYKPGDRISVRFTFRNDMDGISATNCIADIYMTHYDSTLANYVYHDDPVEYGELMPYAGREYSFQYTVMPDDVDRLMAYLDMHYMMLGKEYSASGMAVHYVELYDITFTADLSAEHTTVTRGHDAAFYLRVGNTGTETIQRFEIYNPDGSLLRTMEAMPAGGNGMIDVNWPMSASGSVHYTVKGISGSQSKTVTSNNVAITVRAPSTPAPIASPTPAPAPSPTPEPVTTASPTPAPTPSSSPTPEPISSPTPAVTETPAASPAPNPTPSSTPLPGVTDAPQALNPQVSPSAQTTPTISIPVWLTIPAAALIIAAVLVLIWVLKRSREKMWKE